MSTEKELEKIRQQIDALDLQIQTLISERAGCAQRVAEIKRAENEAAVFYRPEREAEILKTVQERNQGPLSDEVIARLFREIMSACLALEEPLTIAFLGPLGTYSQEAVLKHFGQSVQTSPVQSIDQVFHEVESSNASYGVAPVENSTEGSIGVTLDLLLKTPLTICGEVLLPVHHCLLSIEKEMSDIKKVYAHQQSLSQCKQWLAVNMPNARQVAVASNAEAANIASQENGSAAIAGAVAASYYRLNLLSKNIEDDARNATRFLVLGNQKVLPTGNDVTSLAFATPNKAGALQTALGCFSKHDISMSRIESRPSRQTTWEYVFFVDIKGHVQDEKVTAALASLKDEVTFVKVLGSYPRAVI